MTVRDMINYTVVYKNVKNITLRIQPDGELEITAPHRAGKAEIENVVMKKRNWIVAHQQKAAELNQERQQSGLMNGYQDGGEVAYLGQMYPLSVSAEGRRAWQWDGTKLQLSGCTSEAQIRQTVELFYREKLLDEIIPSLNRTVRQSPVLCNLPEPEFAVRKMRSSWGVCYSGKKKIVLNLWLGMAPIECIRQVLVHEYIHFLQNNHSPEFYALLEQVEPQYRQLKHRLSVMVNIKGGTL